MIAPVPDHRRVHRVLADTRDGGGQALERLEPRAQFVVHLLVAHRHP
ncbi:hypothetical protein [Streptomyces sp. NRRL WC-3725]|nr:hypothetical protein [Streptomyces sp. NRRL WC-3725]